MTNKTQLRPSILIVDDDQITLQILAEVLQTEYTVKAASDGPSALEIARRDKPDLALLDILMPGMSGLEVAQLLKLETRTPFIFLTGYTDKEVIQTAATVGALGFLVKPVDIDRLIPAIQIALARAEDIGKMGQEIADLSIAQEHNREIDVAVGLLMQRHSFDRAAAFEALRSYARSQRCKIREVANRIINGEDIPVSS